MSLARPRKSSKWVSFEQITADVFFLKVRNSSDVVKAVLCRVTRCPLGSVSKISKFTKSNFNSLVFESAVNVKGFELSVSIDWCTLSLIQFRSAGGGNLGKLNLRGEMSLKLLSIFQQ